MIKRREKRSEERKRKKQDELTKTYDDFDWVQMFHKGTLAKLTVPHCAKLVPC